LKYCFFIFCFSITTSTQLLAQDTLVLTLAQADSIFQKENFDLLAESMNVSAQEAQIIQAKIYPNPIFTADINAYDPASNQAFHVGKTGQKVFQIEQLFLLGGKRKTEIDMAKTNANIAKIQFQQLTRELKFKLHNNLFVIGQLQLLLSRYNSQLDLLDNMLSSYQIQVDKGNIPLKDLVRLKAAYLNLNNSRDDIFKQYYKAQSELQILLSRKAIIHFQFTEADIQSYIQAKSIDELIDLARANKPELLLVNENKTLAEQYLQYQKRLAVPDINFFVSYDQRGGAFNNQVNTGISIPLPLWNHNQGNVKSAQFKLKQADYSLQSMENELISDLQNTYHFYNQTLTEYQKSILIYTNDFEITVKGMVDNFQKRNVSLIEFIDFFESYNQVQTELMRVKTQLVYLGEQLNLLIGTDVY
jgi:cobalt-zinc-cadmium efflux system outer membrane protein